MQGWGEGHIKLPQLPLLLMEDNKLQVLSGPTMQWPQSFCIVPYSVHFVLGSAVLDGHGVVLETGFGEVRDRSSCNNNSRLLDTGSPLQQRC